MAAPVMRCCLGKVLAQCPRRIFSRIGCHSAIVPCVVNSVISTRHYAAKARRKSKSESRKKTPEAEPKQKKQSYKPPLPSEPTDDVYLTWCYQRPVYEAEVAVDMLKKFQVLDFTPPNQDIFVDITLDMAKEKKKTVEQFVGTVLLPYRFTNDTHKVLVLTESEEEAALARENGAALAGGTELIKPILDGEIQADFYVAVPRIAPRISSLRGILKKKFPNVKNGSLSYDIPQMLSFFKLCHEYMVENENLIHTPIATLDMPNDQIVANLDAVIKDVCKYKPLSYGPFVTYLTIQSSSSEGLDLKFERFLPKGSVKEKAEEKLEEKEDDSDEEGAMQESK
ncbi:39S ribosomal protein L1, mitochondrial [Hemicordylus capensis]|uniref:39S ribosomal protein L1, mitochondrial n=1 Tax=Hemicordylus capensis TaxID=884348 RepID=UPI00230406E6|nr:39S ribosomal protein L1, mitochondrial [Hemicordylus capensis]